MSNVPPGPGARSDGLLESLRYGASFFFDPFDFVGQRFGRYGDVYYAPSAGVPLYVVRHPEHVREVLVTKADAFANSHGALESLSVLLVEGLLTPDGELWRRHRRILNPAFSRQAIAAVHRMVQERRRTAEDLTIGRPFDVAASMTDLLQMLLDATDPENHDVHSSAREVRDELVTFLLAGHETTSTTLAWALYLLARHPEILREAQREMDLVLGGREPTSDDLEKLHLLDAILKETMRLYPPAYVLARRAVADTSIGPWPVPRGSEVVVWIYFTTVEAKVALATILARCGFELRGPDRVAAKARFTITPKNLTLWPTPRA